MHGVVAYQNAGNVVAAQVFEHGIAQGSFHLAHLERVGERFIATGAGVGFVCEFGCCCYHVGCFSGDYLR